MKNNGGDHYHVALKLASPKRWKSVTEIITSLKVLWLAFVVNMRTITLQGNHYICKEDTSLLHIKHHPDL